MSARGLAGQALARGTRWRPLALFTGLTALAALLGAAELAVAVGGPLLHAPAGGVWTGALDGDTLADVGRVLADRGGNGAVTVALLASLVVALLLAPLLAGAQLAEARSPTPLGWRALLEGAGASWGRLVRLGLVGVVPLAIGAGAFGGLLKWASTVEVHAVTETAALATGRWALGLGALALFVALLTVDAGRAVLAARPARRSAVRAWLAGAFLVLRRPLRTGLSGFLGLVPGVALALLLTAARTRLPPAAHPLALLLGLLAATAVGWGRAVRLAALVEVAHQDLVPREARAQARRLQKQLARAALARAAAATSPAPGPGAPPPAG